MIIQKAITKRMSTFTGIFAASMLLTISTTGWADTGQDRHHDKDRCHHEMGHKMDGGMHGMEPHNAAEHFLHMGKSLMLTDDQIKQLTQLRDDYIDKNAKIEEQIKASHGDVSRMIMGDDIDVKETDGLIDNVGRMKSQLWHAYVQQLHDINAILTTEQKHTLKGMWKNTSFSHG